MWSLYLMEADKLDKARMENWKGDMDGILIFVRIRDILLHIFCAYAQWLSLACSLLLSQHLSSRVTKTFSKIPPMSRYCSWRRYPCSSLPMRVSPCLHYRPLLSRFNQAAQLRASTRSGSSAFFSVSPALYLLPLCNSGQGNISKLSEI